MSTTNRIVLLTPQGQELFSGDSLLSEPPPPPPPCEALAAPMPALSLEGDHDEGDHDEPIPETLRSSVLLRALEPVSRPIIVEDAEQGLLDLRERVPGESPGHRAA